MSTQTKRKHHGPTPYLCCKGASDAIGFYEKAFGAVVVERYVMPAPDGRIGHCELAIGDGALMLADEWPEVGIRSPVTLGGTPVLVHLDVPDLASTVRRAREAGAQLLREENDAHGARATLQDPFGHQWVVSAMAS
jgi:PhnB protein